MADGKNIHVVITASPWYAEGLKHRRHRLARFLKNQKDTSEVFWVYPVVSGVKKINKFIRVARGLEKLVITLPDGIKEYYIPILSGIYMHLLYGETFQRYVSFSVEKILKNHKYDRAIIWYTVPVWPFLSRSLNWNTVVYDCSDLWSSNFSDEEKAEHRLRKKRVLESEQNIVSNSNYVFATSSYLQKWLQNMHGCNAILVENGVEFAKLSGKEIPGVIGGLDMPRPRMVFIGGMKGKIDFKLLELMAKKKPGWSLVLIGPKTEENLDFDKLIKLDNVYWLGSIEHERVAGYLKECDVGLLPFRKIEYNKAVFPLKMFEYMAAGLPVVGCNLPSTEKYSEEGVYAYCGNAEEFIVNCEKMIKMDRFYNNRIKAAEAADWEGKFKFMYETVLSE